MITGIKLYSRLSRENLENPTSGGGDSKTRASDRVYQAVIDDPILIVAAAKLQLFITDLIIRAPMGIGLRKSKGVPLLASARRWG